MMATETSVCATGDDLVCDPTKESLVEVSTSNPKAGLRSVTIECSEPTSASDARTDAHAIVTLRLLSAMGTGTLDALSEDALMDDATPLAVAEVLVRVHCLAIEGGNAQRGQQSRVVPSLHLATHHATDASLEAVAVPKAQSSEAVDTVVAARGRKLFGVLDGWVWQTHDAAMGGSARAGDGSVRASQRWSRLLHVGF